MKYFYTACLVMALLPNAVSAFAKDWVVYEGNKEDGKGKHIVFLTGDEEYRSEEGMPMLGKILAKRHGFKCTVLFAIDPETGNIDPDNQTNLPGFEQIADADLLIIFYRFREPNDGQMKIFEDYLQSGKPIIGLRTATHAFNMKRNKTGPYARYDYRSRTWPGGFGQQVLGETWINHHGHHKREATRGLVNGMRQNHPILKGVTDVFGTSDVYGIRNLESTAQVLLYGATLTGMKPTDPVKLETSLMPIAWTRTYTGKSGNTNRIFCTTMGASVDLLSEGLRRLLVNACYWALEMEDRIPKKSNVDYVGAYNPTFYGFGTYKKGMKPADHELK